MDLTLIHHGHGLINWQVAKRLWWGSLTASAATLVCMTLYPIDADAVDFMKMTIVGAVVLIPFPLH